MKQEMVYEIASNGDKLWCVVDNFVVELEA